MALNRIEKLQGPGAGKHLRNTRRRFRPEKEPDDAVLCYLIITAFFLMRIGEYAHAGYWDHKKS
eukprot:919674-Pyramimonas_sp.AAC.1